MGAWDFFLVLSAGKNPRAHKIPRFRAGGGVWEGGGGECQFYSYGSGDFSESNNFVSEGNPPNFPTVPSVLQALLQGGPPNGGYQVQFFFVTNK